MEIRIEERMTGRALRAAILARYGGRRRLQRAAKVKDANAAKDDLFDLKLFDEDPARLDLDMTIGEVIRLEGSELERFTGTRLRLLEELARAGEPLKLTELSRRLGRDKKNVSVDVRLMAEFGLVHVRRAGRDAWVSPRHGEIHIVIDSRTAAHRRSAIT